MMQFAATTAADKEGKETLTLALKWTAPKKANTWIDAQVASMTAGGMAMAWANEGITEMELASFSVGAKMATVKLDSVGQAKCAATVKDMAIVAKDCRNGACLPNYLKAIAAAPSSCKFTADWKTKWAASAFTVDAATKGASMSWTHPVDAEGKTGMKADAKYNFMAGSFAQSNSKLLMAGTSKWMAVKITAAGASTLVAASVAATAALFL